MAELKRHPALETAELPRHPALELQEEKSYMERHVEAETEFGGREVDVVHAFDGDTFLVKTDSGKELIVRLTGGVNTPETAKPFLGKAQERGGVWAREKAAEEFVGKKATLHLNPVGYDLYDKYGRMLGDVTVDGKSAVAVMGDPQNYMRDRSLGEAISDGIRQAGYFMETARIGVDDYISDQIERTKNAKTYQERARWIHPLSWMALLYPQKLIDIDRAQNKRSMAKIKEGQTEIASRSDREPVEGTVWQQFKGTVTQTATDPDVFVDLFLSNAPTQVVAVGSTLMGAPQAGFALIAMGKAGSEYATEAHDPNSNQDVDLRAAYALLSGIGEAASEMLGAKIEVGIFQAAKGAAKQAGKNAFTKGLLYVANTGAAITKGGAMGGLEEGFAQLNDNVWRKLLLDYSWSTTEGLGEAVAIGVTQEGAMGGGMFLGGKALSKTTEAVQEYRRKGRLLSQEEAVGFINRIRERALGMEDMTEDAIQTVNLQCDKPIQDILAGKFDSVKKTGVQQMKANLEAEEAQNQKEEVQAKEVDRETGEVQPVRVTQAEAIKPVKAAGSESGPILRAAIETPEIQGLLQQIENRAKAEKFQSETADKKGTEPESRPTTKSSDDIIADFVQGRLDTLNKIFTDRKTDAKQWAAYRKEIQGMAQEVRDYQAKNKGEAPVQHASDEAIWKVLDWAYQKLETIDPEDKAARSLIVRRAIKAISKADEIANLETKPKPLFHTVKDDIARMEDALAQKAENRDPFFDQEEAYEADTDAAMQMTSSDIFTSPRKSAEDVSKIQAVLEHLSNLVDSPYYGMDPTKSPAVAMARVDGDSVFLDGKKYDLVNERPKRKGRPKKDGSDKKWRVVPAEESELGEVSDKQTRDPYEYQREDFDDEYESRHAETRLEGPETTEIVQAITNQLKKVSPLLGRLWGPRKGATAVRAALSEAGHSYQQGKPSLYAEVTYGEERAPSGDVLLDLDPVFNGLTTEGKQQAINQLAKEIKGSLEKAAAQEIVLREVLAENKAKFDPVYTETLIKQLRKSLGENAWAFDQRVDKILNPPKKAKAQPTTTIPQNPKPVEITEAKQAEPVTEQSTPAQVKAAAEELRPELEASGLTKQQAGSVIASATSEIGTAKTIDAAEFSRVAEGLLRRLGIVAKIEDNLVNTHAIIDQMFGRSRLREAEIKRRMNNVRKSIAGLFGLKSYNLDSKKPVFENYSLNDVTFSMMLAVDIRQFPNYKDFEIPAEFNKHFGLAERINEGKGQIEAAIKKIVDDDQAWLAQTGREAVQQGAIEAIITHYIPHFWDFITMPQKPLKFKMMKTKSMHMMERSLEGGIAEGLSKGMRLEITDYSTAIQRSQIAMNQTVNVIRMIKEGSTLGVFKDKAGDGYVAVELPTRVKPDGTFGTQTLYAPQKIAKHLKNSFSDSKLRGIPGMQLLDEIQTTLKEILLTGSLFHPRSLAWAFIFGQGREGLNPVKAFQQGKESIEQFGPLLRELVYCGLTVGAHLDFDAHADQKKTFLAKGMSKTAVTDKAYKLVRGAGDSYSRFVFEVLGARLKAQAAIIMAQKELNKHLEDVIEGKISRETILKSVALRMNNDFGGIDYQREGWNPTWNHILKHFFLGHDYNVSGIRSWTDAFRKGQRGSVHRTLWANIAAKYISGWFILNMGLSFGDDKDFFERLAEAWYNGGPSVAGRILKVLDVDITPVYRLFGGDQHKRKYLNIAGEYKDTLKWILRPFTTLWRKRSRLLGMAASGVTGTNVWGQKYTTLEEFSDSDKGFRESLTRYKRKDEGLDIMSPEQMPSYLMDQAIEVLPTWGQSFLQYSSGQADGLDTILELLGGDVTSSGRTQQPQKFDNPTQIKKFLKATSN